ncbi:MAG: hypothetical protein U9P90_01155, partial [Patescibacteria group bacterium]|nr:hypothetical protein [Patescibacteria group bacterium]
MKKTIALAIVFTCMFLVGCELISSAYAEPAIVTPTVIGPIESRDRAVKIHILRDPTRRINCYIPTTAYATTPSC